MIGRPARNLTRENALEHVAGYTICNDITTRSLVYRRDLKAIGTDWFAAKNAPTFLPTGPFLVPAVFAGDPARLRITLQHNGITRQDESCADMLFDLPAILAYVTAVTELARATSYSPAPGRERRALGSVPGRRGRPRGRDHRPRRPAQPLRP